MEEGNRASVFCWGWGGNGQLGNKDLESRIKPQPLTHFLHNSQIRISDVVCGSRCTLARSESGNVYSWGKNDDGQLGTGDLRLQQTPRLIEGLSAVHIVKLACKGSHVLALSDEGFVYSWGRGDEGQLGHGNYKTTSEPTLIERLCETSITGVSCGRSHSVAINTEGSIFTWGCNDDGALGYSSTTKTQYPKRISSMDAIKVKEIVCGSRHTLALTKEGSVYAWGWNIYGQLGLGHNHNVLKPVRIPAFSPTQHKVIQIYAGFRHCFAVTRSVSACNGKSFDSTPRRGVGTHKNRCLSVDTPTLSRQALQRTVNVWGWGWNQYSQLGVVPSLYSESRSSIYLPFMLPDLQDVDLVGLSAGGRHSFCTVNLISTGDGTTRQGDSSSPHTQNTAGKNTKIRRCETDPLLTDAYGNFRTYGWGRGSDGQLGTGFVTEKEEHLSLIPYLSRRNVKQLACGWAHSCALVYDDLLSVSSHEVQDEKMNAKEEVDITKWWKVTLGDLDGFFGMLVQCLIQLMLIFQSLPLKCGFSTKQVTQEIIPAVSSTIALGNILFAGQGIMLARHEGRPDVTAQPQGINTVLLFAYMLLVMAPEYNLSGSSQQAWEVGVFASLMTGLCQIACLPFVSLMKRLIPRAALLSSVAGVALTFLSMGFAFEIWQNPAIALPPLFLIIICYGARLKLPLRIPTGLGALICGTILAFGLYYCGLPTYFVPFTQFYRFEIETLFRPRPSLVWKALTSGNGWKYMSVVLPMVLVNLMSNLANLQTAHSVGDSFDPSFSILGDSLVTIVGALLGNPFPTALFIGQPIYKSMGARNSYLLLNAVSVALVAFFNGTALILNTVPVSCGVGFLLWIGLMVTASSFEVDPDSNSNHSAAVALGLVPALAAWAFQLVQTTITACLQATTHSSPVFTFQEVIDQLKYAGVNPAGLMALSQGYLLTSIFLSSTLVHIIEREFDRASLWMIIASILSYTGAVHSYTVSDHSISSTFGFVPGGITGWPMQYGTVYLGLSILLLLFHLRESETTIFAGIVSSYCGTSCCKNGTNKEKKSTYSQSPLLRVNKNSKRSSSDVVTLDISRTD